MATTSVQPMTGERKLDLALEELKLVQCLMRLVQVGSEEAIVKEKIDRRNMENREKRISNQLRRKELEEENRYVVVVDRPVPNLGVGPGVDPA